MSLFVDKEKKRRQIILACKSLILDNKLCELPISKIAQTSNVGKGTFYEYFKNKEDLVYETINFLFQDYIERKISKISTVSQTEEKVKTYFNFFFDDSIKEFRAIYLKFISIYISNPSSKIKEFQKKYELENCNILDDIINTAIKKKEINEKSDILIKELYDLSENIYIRTNSIKKSKNQMEQFFKYFYNIIKINF